MNASKFISCACILMAEWFEGVVEENVLGAAEVGRKGGGYENAVPTA